MHRKVGREGRTLPWQWDFFIPQENPVVRLREMRARRAALLHHKPRILLLNVPSFLRYSNDRVLI